MEKYFRSSTTSGGCLYFYYNMEGGPSVELKIYIQAGVNKAMTFYANGIDMKTDQWKKGWFNIPPGGTDIVIKVKASSGSCNHVWRGQNSFFT
jgi:hypothetical protein